VICEVLHITPMDQDRMAIGDFEDACDYIDAKPGGE
jgi:hypothetical protein